MLSALLVSASLFFLLLFIVRGTYKPEKFPPGPPRLPLIGSLLCMHMSGTNSSPSLLHSFQCAAQKYGALVGFYLGSFPALLVSDFQILKDLYKVMRNAIRFKYITFCRRKRSYQLGLPSGRIMNAGLDGSFLN